MVRLNSPQVSQKGDTLSERSESKGFAPVLIVLILTVIAIGAGLFVYQNKPAFVPPEQTTCTLEAMICPDGTSVGRTGPNCEFTPCPTSQNIDTSAWETYRAPGYIGIRVKYPNDKLVGNVTEHFENSEDKPTQDENLILWLATIPLENSNILISRRHNLNSVTNKPYDSIEEYDLKTSSYRTIQVSQNDAKDSQEYLNDKNEHQRDIIFFRNNYIWTIQEISPKEANERYLDGIISTWTFFEYSPSENGVYKDVDK
jgi:hypothetical protein